MDNQLLLLEDIGRLGRKGDIIKVKPGYARNFLLPQKKAVVATANTLRMRARLQEEREKQAKQDKVEAERLAKIIQGKVLSIEVKVDPAGHMYGSVSAQEIVKLFEEQGVDIERQYILLTHPIKVTGEHKIELRLKEGVLAYFHLHILAEGKPLQMKKETVSEEATKEGTFVEVIEEASSEE
jgi:large subunit ribosomal protein L9